MLGHRMLPSRINLKHESLMDKTWGSFTGLGREDLSDSHLWTACAEGLNQSSYTESKVCAKAHHKEQDKGVVSKNILRVTA